MLAYPLLGCEGYERAVVDLLRGVSGIHLPIANGIAELLR
jgi:hypothetical protein